MGIFPTNYTDKGSADSTDKVFSSDGVTNFNLTVDEIGNEVFTDRSTTNLAEGTNEYHTTAKVEAIALSKTNTDAYTPTLEYHPATKGYTDSVAGGITGEVRLWTTDTPPSNWLILDGSAVSRTTYADLFAVIGTTYGIGDGSTTFNIPDLQGNIPVGKDGATFASLGDTGGEETHTLTESEMPTHTHSSIIQEAYDGVNPGSSSNNNTIKAGTTGSTGGGAAHNNLQPYIVLNYIIKT